MNFTLGFFDCIHVLSGWCGHPHFTHSNIEAQVVKKKNLLLKNVFLLLSLLYSVRPCTLGPGSEFTVVVSGPPTLWPLKSETLM